MNPLVTPTVHINGTSKEELVRQRLVVMEAARLLLDRMKEATPNARDYYTVDIARADAARDAWRERMAVVDRLINDVERDAMKIALIGA